jgi:hypothetical protein
MNEWGTITGLLCFGLLVFLLWKEWARADPAFRMARLVATVIAVVSLYLLAVPPGYNRVVKQDGNQLLVLTDGAQDNSVRAVSGYDKMPLYDLRKGKDGVALDDVLDRHPGTNVIHLFGYGLPQHQLNKMDGQKLVFHPSEAPEGFSTVMYNKALEQGEVLQVQGKYHSSDSGHVKILLIHFGMVLDSAMVSHGVFNLRHVPAHVGRATYSIAAVSKTDTLEKQILPLVVNDRKSFRVLFMGSSPGFENRFLKDWLLRRGYQVVSRTRLSKNVFSKEFVNNEKLSIDRINEAVLREIDLIVSDQEALLLLTPGELSLIKQRIAVTGTGLMYWGEGEGRGPFGVKLGKMPGGEQQKLDLLLGDSLALKTLGTENQFDIVAASSVQPLVKTQGGRIVASANQEGKGRVVVTTIGYSYKWMLAGAAKDYDQYWTALLSEALGVAAEDKWTVTPEWGYVHQPLDIIAETLDSVPSALIDDQAVYMENDPLNQVHWRGRYWPETAGWHALQTSGRQHWFYVFDQDAWQPLKKHTRIKETADFVSSSISRRPQVVKQEFKEHVQVPLIIYVLLFMISAGFLWFENKRMVG